MGSPHLRRTAALLSSAILLATLLVVSGAAAPTSAQILTCGGLPVTIQGTPGDDFGADRIEGTNGPDVIHGLGGDDEISGFDGDDIICGGSGGDLIFAGQGADVVYGQSGADVIQGGPGNDEICGGGGPDILGGGPDDDTIAGGPGRDQIYGGPDWDRLFGYRGASCQQKGRDGRDIIKGQAGEDRIFGGPGPDILYGNKQNDFIRGQSGNDRINGGAAIDNCLQNAGRGPVRRCEKADLAVAVRSPATAGEQFAFTVRVRNRGPNPSSYDLLADENNSKASCDFSGEGLRRSFAVLGSGKTRRHTFQVTCTIGAGDSYVAPFARVFADARDPRPGNDLDDAKTILE